MPARLRGTSRTLFPLQLARVSVFGFILKRKIIAPTSQGWRSAGRFKEKLTGLQSSGLQLGMLRNNVQPEPLYECLNQITSVGMLSSDLPCQWQ